MKKLCKFYKECKKFSNDAMVCIDSEYRWRGSDNEMYCGTYRELSKDERLKNGSNNSATG